MTAPAVQPDPARRSGLAQDPERLRSLIEAAGGGDRQAFRQLYALSSRYLFGLVLAVLHRREMAEEVLQEAYVTIWQRASSYDRNKGSPMAWLSTIARNKAIDRLRAERARGFVSFTDEVPDIAIDFDPETASTDAITIGRILTEMKAEYRDALILSYFRGYTHAELAKALGVPLGTAKSWVRRGLAAVKQALE